MGVWRRRLSARRQGAIQRARVPGPWAVSPCRSSSVASAPVIVCGVGSGRDALRGRVVTRGRSPAADAQPSQEAGRPARHLPLYIGRYVSSRSPSRSPPSTLYPVADRHAYLPFARGPDGRDGRRLRSRGAQHDPPADAAQKTVDTRGRAHALWFVTRRILFSRASRGPRFSAGGWVGRDGRASGAGNTVHHALIAQLDKLESRGPRLNPRERTASNSRARVERERGGGTG